MKLKTRLFEIKEGKLDTWRQWCDLLQTKYLSEAQETLQEEKVTAEFFLVFEIDGKSYTLGGGFFEEKILEPTERELNHLHMTKKKECLIPVAEPDLLYLIAEK